MAQVGRRGIEEWQRARIIRLSGEGQTKKDIAKNSGVSVNTVKKVLAEVPEKVG